MSNSKGLVAAGGSLMRRHQRLVWWVFAVSLILSLMGGGAMRAMLSSVADHSLVSKEITGQLHLARYIELIMQPEVNFGAGMAPMFSMQIVFFVYMLFILGGILAVYREDRKLSKAEFFENCGLYFWRFVRLTLISLIPIGLVLALYAGVRAIGNKIAEASPLESREFWWRMIGGLVVLALFLLVRLWFDVAQVRAQAQNERSMWKNTFRSWKIMWNAAGTLLWMYFRISLVAWVVLAAGIWVWVHIPGRLYMLSFLLLEVVTLVQIAVRLWLRASAVKWYEAYAQEHPAAVVEFTTPKPTEVLDGTATP